MRGRYLRGIIASRGDGSAWLIGIPSEIGVIAKFSSKEVRCLLSTTKKGKIIPRTHQVRNSKQSPEDNADSTNNHIGDSHKGVLASKHCSSGYQDGLGSIIFGDIET